MASRNDGVWEAVDVSGNGKTDGSWRFCAFEVALGQEFFVGLKFQRVPFVMGSLECFCPLLMR